MELPQFTLILRVLKSSALVALFMLGGFAQAQLHHSEAFLESLRQQSRIEAPRLALAAMQTSIALPSRLERWHITGTDAAASYNDWTNTLVLKPEMIIHDLQTSVARIRTLAELRTALGHAATPTAAVIFHELSHAEWDLFVEEEAEPYDSDLMQAIRAELPALLKTSGLSILRRGALPSEIFAYYREELVSQLLQDTFEIKQVSGLDPETNACDPARRAEEDLRNVLPDPRPYKTRVKLKTAFVSGDEVNLDLDPAANARLNRALFAHAEATLRFPASRADLLDLLNRDPRLRDAVAGCMTTPK